MKILIRPHDLGKGSALELAKKARDFGFDGVQLAIAKAIEGQTGNPGTLTPSVISEIRNGFNGEGIEIPILGAYFNPVHSNAQKANAGAEKYADHLRHAHEFGATFVSSETGSYNDDSWTYNPKNQTEEAFQKVLSVFEPLARVAATCEGAMSIEGAWGHCMFCPEQLLRLETELEKIAPKKIFAIIDILNYLYIGNYKNREKIFSCALELFKGKIAAFHIKDFVVEGDKLVEVPIGSGIMGWNEFLPEIKSREPNSFLVFEGVKDVPKSLEFVRSFVG